jgi:hypothetical protein
MDFEFPYLKGLNFCYGLVRRGLHILCRCCHQNETNGKQSDVADMNGTHSFQIRRCINCTDYDAPVLHQLVS